MVRNFTSSFRSFFRLLFFCLEKFFHSRNSRPRFVAWKRQHHNNILSSNIRFSFESNSKTRCGRAPSASCRSVSKVKRNKYWRDGWPAHGHTQQNNICIEISVCVFLCCPSVSSMREKRESIRSGTMKESRKHSNETKTENANAHESEKRLLKWIQKEMVQKNARKNCS